MLVAKGYRPVDRDQQFLLPVDMREWLPVSDPVFTVIDVVAALDTSAVHAVRRTGGVVEGCGHGQDLGPAVTIAVG